jgi:DNA-binding MarR family transcriptional regulator
MLESDVARYEHLKEALAQATEGDPSICDLFLDLLQTGELAARCEANFLSPHGLNPARLIILVLLNNADSGSMRSSELADCAKVSRATMTGLLDTLEKAGLLVRAPDPHDRRASSVKITAQGEALLEIVQPKQSLWARGVLAPLSLEECSQLAGLLKKIRSALGAVC